MHIHPKKGYIYIWKGGWWGAEEDCGDRSVTQTGRLSHHCSLAKETDMVPPDMGPPDVVSPNSRFIFFYIYKFKVRTLFECSLRFASRHSLRFKNEYNWIFSFNFDLNVWFYQYLGQIQSLIVQDLHLCRNRAFNCSKKNCDAPGTLGDFVRSLLVPLWLLPLKALAQNVQD